MNHNTMKASLIALVYLLLTPVPLLPVAFAESTTTQPAGASTTPAPASPTSAEEPDDADMEEAEAAATSRPEDASTKIAEPTIPIEQLTAVPGALFEKRELLLKEIKEAKAKGVGTRAYVTEFMRIEESVKSNATEGDVEKRIDSLLKTVKSQISKQETLKTQSPSSTGSVSGSGGTKSRFLQRGTPEWERVHNPPGNLAACKAAEAAGTIHVLNYNVIVFQEKQAMYTRSEKIIGSGHRFDQWNIAVRKIVYIRMDQINNYVKTVPGVLGAHFVQAGLALSGQPYSFNMCIVYDARSKNIRPMIEKIQKDYHLALLKCRDTPARYMPADITCNVTWLGQSPDSNKREDHFPFILDFVRSEGLLP